MMENKQQTHYPCKLTGRYYFKRTILGLVLTVEKVIEYPTGDETTFINANVHDLFDLGLIESKKPVW
jgi:hypothetical protein